MPEPAKQNPEPRRPEVLPIPEARSPYIGLGIEDEDEEDFIPPKIM